MGLGLAALGRPGYINIGHAEDLQADYDVDHMRQRTHAMLDAAWEAGIRYIDVARSYGRGEEFLSSWLAGRDAATSGSAQPAVGSKWGYTYTADWKVDAEQHEVKEHSRSNLARQLAITRRLLGNSLSLYQAHSVTFSSGLLDDAALLDDLAAVKASGTAIGLSLSGTDQGEVLAAALEVERDGRRLFDTVQATYNVLEPSAGPALRRARALGMGIIIKEGVANGRLTPRGDAAQPGGVLDTIATDHNVTVDAVALAAIMRQDWVDVALSGAATVEHLRANLAAVSVRLDEQELDQLAMLAEEPAQYWATRSGLGWA